MIHRNFYSRILLLMIVLLCTFSCEDSASEIAADPFSIYKIDQGNESIVFNGFNEFTNGRLENSFEASDILFMTNNETEQGRFSVINSKDLSETISFNVLVDGSIVDIIRNKTTVLQEGVVKSEYLTLEGELRYYTIDDINSGTREFHFAESENGRSESGDRSWYSYFDECFETINEPIPDNNFANHLFAIVANGLTVGAYSTFSGLVCAGVAVGQVNRGYLSYYYPITTVNSGFPISVDELRQQLNIQFYGG